VLIRGYSDLTFSLPGLDHGDVPLLLAVLSKKQCKDTLVQALLRIEYNPKAVAPADAKLIRCKTSFCAEKQKVNGIELPPGRVARSKCPT
jgi:hypothetical protein